MAEYTGKSGRQIVQTHCLSCSARYYSYLPKDYYQNPFQEEKVFGDYKKKGDAKLIGNALLL